MIKSKSLQISQHNFDGMFKKHLQFLERQPEKFFGDSKSYEIYYFKKNYYRFKKITNYIPHSIEGLNILDIGTTEFTFLLKKLFPHYKIYSIDISDRMRRRISVEKVIFREYDITQGNLSFEGIKFDIIIFAEVFEHLFICPSVVFENLKSLLKKEGLLIFQTPNFTRLINRLKLVIGINPTPSIYRMTKFDKVGHGHVREYTLSECVNIISQYKFRIIKAHHEIYWDRWDISLLLLIWKKRRLILIYSLLPILWGYHLLCFLIPPFRSGISILAQKLYSDSR